MPLFQTIIHPTDFDEPSQEAFRIARGLAQAVGARVVAFHVVAPPAVVAPDGKVILDPRHGEPIDLWASYRAQQQADAPNVPVQFATVVGTGSDAKQLLKDKVREFGAGVLIVMGSHGRSGIKKLIWGNQAEGVLRDLPCPVLVVKAAIPEALPAVPEGTTR